MGQKAAKWAFLLCRVRNKPQHRQGKTALNKAEDLAYYSFDDVILRINSGHHMYFELTSPSWYY